MCLLMALLQSSLSSLEKENRLSMDSAVDENGGGEILGSAFKTKKPAQGMVEPVDGSPR